ncbi:hypothetical protein Dimus_019388 [Dionaea muscipula]
MLTRVGEEERRNMDADEEDDGEVKVEDEEAKVVDAADDGDGDRRSDGGEAENWSALRVYLKERLSGRTGPLGRDLVERPIRERERKGRDSGRGRKWKRSEGKEDRFLKRGPSRGYFGKPCCSRHQTGNL